MIFNTQTELYALIGSPVSHSQSPRLFNQIFQYEKMNRVYLAFEHSDASQLIQSMRRLNIRGCSVTLPHKETVFNLVDKTDDVTKKLKAVNTVVQRDGVLTGYNTDGLGAIEAIEEHERNFNQAVGSWKKKNLTILGSGGAARGIGLTMMNFAFSGSIRIIARNSVKATSLVKDIRSLGGQATFTAWEKLDQMGVLETDLIINTTSLGMSSKVGGSGESPLKKGHLDSSTIVFDIVYTPIETPLLCLAKKKSCPRIDGLEMFLAQANHQLFIWTGKKLPLKQLRVFFSHR